MSRFESWRDVATLFVCAALASALIIVVLTAEARKRYDHDDAHDNHNDNQHDLGKEMSGNNEKNLVSVREQISEDHDGILVSAARKVEAFFVSLRKGSGGKTRTDGGSKK